MASMFGRRATVALTAPLLMLAAAGCGESFIGTGTGGGGSGATTGSGATGGTGGSGETCNPQTTQACYTGPEGTDGKGVCKKGVQTCTAEGQWGSCDGEVKPSTETCDGFDNDCDTVLDNGCDCTPEDTQKCYDLAGTPGQGPCMKGLSTCKSDATWGPCVGAIGPNPEECNDADDDCDGVKDNNPIGAGEDCNVSGQIGQCALGLTACHQGGFICEANIGETPEECDGVDNNCDGAVDNVDGLGDTCDTGQVGVCQQGSWQCEGNSLTCVQKIPESAEKCDGADNDCNGIIDNEPVDVGTPCNFTGPGGFACGGTNKCSANGALNCVPVNYFTESFSNPMNWTTGGQWEIGAAMSGTASAFQLGNLDPADDHTPAPSADKKLAGVEIGGNANNLVHGPDFLVSPVIDTNKDGPVYLAFYRWLNTDVPGNMQDTIEVSKDGGQNWTLVWINEASMFDSSWNRHVVDVSSFKSANFRVRFGIKVLLLSAEVSSWNIDDVVITSCPPPG